MSEDMYKRDRKLFLIKERFQKGQTDKNGNVIWKGCISCFDLMQGFERKLRLSDYSNARILKYWYFYRMLHEKLEKCLDKANKTDIENLVISIDSDDSWNHTTKIDLKRGLKFLGRYILNGTIEGDYPETFKWIKSRMKISNTKAPEHVLSVSEVESIANVSSNLRDKALVLVLFESGCRLAEFLNIKFKDVESDDFGCKISVTGKTGGRKIRIVDYYKDFYKWLDSHPAKSPESFVWISLENSSKRISPSTANGIVKDLANKAGITKRVHPHLFRHSIATIDAKRYPEAIMKQKFGWTMDSDMASVYYHLSMKDMDDVVLKGKGIKQEDIDNNKPESKLCQRCSSMNSAYSHFCKKCNLPLDTKGIIEFDDKVQRIVNIFSDFFINLSDKNSKIGSEFKEFVRSQNAEDLFRFKNNGGDKTN